MVISFVSWSATSTPDQQRLHTSLSRAKVASGSVGFRRGRAPFLSLKASKVTRSHQRVGERSGLDGDIPWNAVHCGCVHQMSAKQIKR